MRDKNRGYEAIPLIFLLSALLLTAVFTHSYMLLRIPVSAKSTTRLITIKPGWGLRRIGQVLQQEGLVPSAELFTVVARLRGAKIIAGEYLLNRALTPLQILNVLQQGKAYLYKVTIPEGFTVRQISQLLSNRGLAENGQFFTIVNSPAWAKTLLRLDINSLEGYLFPDTYYFAKGVPVENIILAMVERFKQVFDEEQQRQALKSGLSPHEIITLASLIEKETAVDAERPLISAVYHNRLKQGIRLQCDPTVIYALELLNQYDGNLSRDDLLLDSPYNTYYYKGLPPGPIANPGEDSILAALNPAEEDYIYFVSRNDGTHQFSRSLDEHNLAVNHYQRQSFDSQ
ncbi:MAG: endolytic transglycosylase MltG [Candidatus Schekmanbacteria bacterium]|nr:endolytic transglycosylase MltG [Candidatus Schekmanbacteria bacterium]